MLAPYGYDEFGIPYSTPQTPEQEVYHQEQQAIAKEQEAILYDQIWGGLPEAMTYEEISTTKPDYLHPNYAAGFDYYTEWDERPLDEQVEEKKYQQMVEEEKAKLGDEYAYKPEPQYEMGAMGSAPGGTPTTSLLAPKEK